MDNQSDFKKYPYNFNKELINKELDFWIYKKDYQKALDILEDIELKWFRAKNEGVYLQGKVLNIWRRMLLRICLRGF